MLNPYTYVTADPTNHTDPTGMAPQWANWAIFGANVGGAIAGVGLTLATFGASTPYVAAGLIALNLAASGTTLATALHDMGEVDLGTRAAPLRKWGYGLTAFNMVADTAAGAFAGFTKAAMYRGAKIPEGPLANLQKIYGKNLHIADSSLWTAKVIEALNDLPEWVHEDVAGWLSRAKNAKAGLYINGAKGVDGGSGAVWQSGVIEIGSSPWQQLMWGEKAPARVAVHEVGHAIDHAYGTVTTSTEFRTLAAFFEVGLKDHPVLGKVSYIRDYIKTPQEYWAEAFAHHFLAPPNARFLHPEKGVDAGWADSAWKCFGDVAKNFGERR
jgi:hypothetical protein